MQNQTLIFNVTLIDAQTDEKGAILIQDSKIVKCLYESSSADCAEIEQLKATLGSTNTFDGEGNTLMPSFIDMHVHLRNPGQEAKETIDSFLKAAAAGGYGTLVAMPNTNPVVSDMDLAHSIQDQVAQHKMAHLIQSISITRNFDGKDISELAKLPSVTEPAHFPLVTEDGKDVASAALMLEAMSECAKKGIIVSCHSEDASLTEPARALRTEAVALLKNHPAKDWASLSSSNSTIDIQRVDTLFKEANDYLGLAEDIATERNIALAEKAACHVHIAHTSTKKAIEAVRRQKAALTERGLQAVQQKPMLSCEIAPHHFALSADDEGFLRYIVNPPIRGSVDQQALLQALVDGTADVIATDHAPHSEADKQSGAPGFSGLETAFAASYTALVHAKLIDLKKLSSLMSAKPATLLGLSQKGRLKTGFDADLVLVNPNSTWTVDSTAFHTQGSVCPFEGKTLYGKVLHTWFGGKKVF